MAFGEGANMVSDSEMTTIMALLIFCPLYLQNLYNYIQYGLLELTLISKNEDTILSKLPEAGRGAL